MTPQPQKSFYQNSIVPNRKDFQRIFVPQSWGLQSIPPKNQKYDIVYQTNSFLCRLNMALFDKGVLPEIERSFIGPSK